MFKKHHYLTNEITKFMTCYCLYVNNNLAGFMALIPAIQKNRYRIARTVILPEFQGIGISGKWLNTMAAMYKSIGITLTTRTIHPARKHFLKNSNKWEALSSNEKPTKIKTNITNNFDKTCKKKHTIFLGRKAAAYKYVGEKDDDNEIVRINKEYWRNISQNQLSLF